MSDSKKGEFITPQNLKETAPGLHDFLVSQGMPDLCTGFCTGFKIEAMDSQSIVTVTFVHIALTDIPSL